MLNALEPSSKKFRKMDSQNAKILRFLEQGFAVYNNIGGMSHFDCIRIGARIYDLRRGVHDGIYHKITTDIDPESGYAVYSLESES